MGQASSLTHSCRLAVALCSKPGSAVAYPPMSLRRKWSVGGLSHISLKIWSPNMVLVSLGIRTADWTTKSSVTFDPVIGIKDRGVLFFLQQVTPAINTTNQYLALVARLGTSYGDFQTPLEAKYFPSVDGIMFIVALPDADYDRDVVIEVLALPKEFKPGSRSADSVALELFYDDELIRDVTVPIA